MISLIILAASGILILFVGLGKQKALLAPLGITTLALAAFFLLTGTGQQTEILKDMIVFDHFASSFSLVMVLLTALIFLLGIEYYDAMEHHVAENFALMLFSLTGALLMVSFHNMVVLFLGIEILSIPLYILSGSKKFSYRSNEASFKYYVLGSFASAFLLFGIALVYGLTASFDLDVIREYAFQQLSQRSPLYISGLIMIFIGMTFKVAAAPFHFWSPDVYEGSPTLITAFMATVVKTAGIAALWRLLDQALIPLPDSLMWMLWIITFLTLAVGNLTALWQTSFKRLLAYSGIANSGFLMLIILVADPAASSTLLYYTFTYGLATLMAFSILFTVKRQTAGSEQIEIFTGLWRRHPFLAVMLTLSLLSLAGIPPLAGFFAKYLAFFQAIGQHFVWITLFAIIMALVGIYYYFSVLRFIYSSKEEPRSLHLPLTTVIVLLLCGMLILFLGLCPNCLTRW